MDGRSEEKPIDVDLEDLANAFAICLKSKAGAHTFPRTRQWREVASPDIEEVFGAEKTAALFDRLQEFEEKFGNTPYKRGTISDEMESILKNFKELHPECPRNVRNYFWHKFGYENR